MPKVALIAPYSQLHRCLSKRYQMLLPEPLAESEEYRRYAKYFGRNGGRDKYYVILDNGAAEGTDITPMRLLELAQEYRVNEIVVPDALREPNVSFSLLENFLDFYQAYTSGVNSHLRDTLHLMIPIHAQSIYSGQRYIDAVNSLCEAAKIKDVATLGFPRDLLHTIDLAARTDLIHYAAREHPEYPLHMLGMNYKWPAEVAQPYIRNYVRSVDTSIVFTYTARDKHLHDIGQPLDLILGSRPADYFDLAAPKFDPVLLRENLRVFDEWAGGTKTGSEGSLVPGTAIVANLTDTPERVRQPEGNR